MRMLLAVAFLVLVVGGVALLVRGSDDGEPTGGGNEGGEPARRSPAASEAQAPSRAGEGDEPPRSAPGQEPPPAREGPAGRERERRPGELRPPDRPECRVPDAFDVPGCSGPP